MLGIIQIPKELLIEKIINSEILRKYRIKYNYFHCNDFTFNKAFIWRHGLKIFKSFLDTRTTFTIFNCIEYSFFLPLFLTLLISAPLFPVEANPCELHYPGSLAPWLTVKFNRSQSGRRETLFILLPAWTVCWCLPYTPKGHISQKAALLPQLEP